MRRQGGQGTGPVTDRGERRNGPTVRDVIEGQHGGPGRGAGWQGVCEVHVRRGGQVGPGGRDRVERAHGDDGPAVIAHVRGSGDRGGGDRKGGVGGQGLRRDADRPVSYTHLRAHETV